MKLFYFLDFGHVKQYATPVTADTYVNLEYGPIPSTIKNLVDEAADEPDDAMLSDTIIVERSDGQKLHRIRGVRPFSKDDERYFAPNELQLLRSVCERFRDANAQTIKNAAHAESPWKKTKLLDQIPYTLAADDADCVVTRDEIETACSVLLK